MREGLYVNRHSGEPYIIRDGALWGEIFPGNPHPYYIMRTDEMSELVRNALIPRMMPPKEKQ